MLKKFENFFKGISHDSSQISPIPPEGYGERFIKFIIGITKTREQAERELTERVAAEAAQEQADAAAGDEGHHGRRRSRSHSQLTQLSNADNSVIQRAEAQAMKSEKHSSKKDDRPERTLLALRSPSAERTNGVNGAILPVVEEAGEASSTGGRSNQTADGEFDEKGERPPTPPKDIGLPLTKTPSPPPTRAPPPPPTQQSSASAQGSPTRPPPPPPINEMGNEADYFSEAQHGRSRSNSWKDKALPPVPRVSSPEVMNEREKSKLELTLEMDRGLLRI